MPSLNEEDLNECEFDELDFDYTVDEDILLEALIEAFSKTGQEDFAEVLQVVRRAHRLKTEEFIGKEGAIGAQVTYIDGNGEPHRGIILEPEVSSMSANEAYDPNKDEMVDPSQYPAGTCQLIYGDGWDFGVGDGFFDRLKSDHKGRGLEVATSVTPGTVKGQEYAYYAGWDYFDRLTEDEGE